MIIRPVCATDLVSLYEISTHALTGLTTLPHDKKILESKIKESVNSFNNFPEKPGGETFLFVLEDPETKKIIGTSSVITKVGGFQPFYTYKIKTTYKRSKFLNVRKKISFLQLKVDHDGPSEIGTLFLLPEYRRAGLGRLLSLSRFLFIAQYRKCFESTILAELRGVFDKEGHSAFWEALGRHFFEVTFERADLMVMKDKSFIAELMPKHPIYIPLLTRSAQAVIGREDDATRPARRMLESEGFKYNNEVDIFEAGPVLETRIENIRSVSESCLSTFAGITQGGFGEEIYMVANVAKPGSFCVAKAKLKINKQNEIYCDERTTRQLNLKTGDSLRYATLHGKTG